MITQKVVCDVCGSEKRDSNHWVVAGVDSAFPAGLTFVSWKDYGVISPYVKHVCGQECAHKILSQWMEAQHNA